MPVNLLVISRKDAGEGMGTRPEIHTTKFAFHKPLNSAKNSLTVYFTAIFFFQDAGIQGCDAVSSD